MFGVDNISSYHADNLKNNFLVLSEWDTFSIDGSFGEPEKKTKNISINFSKTNTKYCRSLHFNADNSYFLVNGKQIFKFKAPNKNFNIPT